jgi:hypothetical protein
MTEVGARAVAAPIYIAAAELECTLETHVASESKDDGTQEDSADVHKENGDLEEKGWRSLGEWKNAMAFGLMPALAAYARTDVDGAVEDLKDALHRDTLLGVVGTIREYNHEFAEQLQLRDLKAHIWNKQSVGTSKIVRDAWIKAGRRNSRFFPAFGSAEGSPEAQRMAREMVKVKDKVGDFRDTTWPFELWCPGLYSCTGCVKRPPAKFSVIDSLRNHDFSDQFCLFRYTFGANAIVSKYSHAQLFVATSISLPHLQTKAHQKLREKGVMQKQMVIGFRGSENFAQDQCCEDWFCTDFILCSVPFPAHTFHRKYFEQHQGDMKEHRFHAGILAQYWQVREMLFEKIRHEMKEAKNVDASMPFMLQVTGHSLGGGLAELMLYDLVLAVLENRKYEAEESQRSAGERGDGDEGLPPLPGLKMSSIVGFTVAPAPALNEAAAGFVNRHLRCNFSKKDDEDGKWGFANRIVNDADPVPATGQSCQHGGCAVPLCCCCTFFCNGCISTSYKGVGKVVWFKARPGELYKSDHFEASSYWQGCLNRTHRFKQLLCCCASAFDHTGASYALKVNHYAALPVYASTAVELQKDHPCCSLQTLTSTCCCCFKKTSQDTSLHRLPDGKPAPDGKGRFNEKKLKAAYAQMVSASGKWVYTFDLGAAGTKETETRK